MYRLNTVGQHKVAAALLLLACLGVGQSAFAAPPPSVNNAVADYSVNEDAAPRLIDLTNVFRNGTAPRTYSVASNSDPTVINAFVTGNRWLNINYLPNANGVVTIKSQITDALGRIATDRFVVTVRKINDAPTFVASPAPVVVSENHAPVTVNLAGMFTDVDLSHEGDVLTLSVSGNSDPTLFSSPPSIAGNVLTLRFAANKNGFSSLTIKVRDTGGLTATGPVDVTVNHTNNPPVVSTPIPDQFPPEDAPPIPVVLNSYITDPDTISSGDVLTYTVTANSNPALISTNVAGSLLTLTLAPNGNGIANLTVQAVDTGGQRVSDSFVVNVGGVNDTPVAVDDTFVINEDGGPIDLPVLANDTHGDDPTIVISAGRTWNILGVDYPDSTESTPTTVRTKTNDEVTLPNGTLLVSDSVVTYTPKPDFNGTDSFHYTIRDVDGQVSTANVTITINPVNDTPIEAGTLDYTVVQGDSLNILASGGIVNRSWDADGDPITVVQQSVPASVGAGFAGTTLGLQPDGSFLYVPDPTFVGTDTFDIKLFDGFGLSSVYTVTIQVTPTPPPPPPPPPGTVSGGLTLAQLPLEDAVSAEANVLVIMDDSGSMDWAIMTNEANGVFQFRNAGVKDAATTSTSNTFAYLMPLATNNDNTNTVPTEEGLTAANAIFGGNQFGAWRARNSQFNTVYYNPKILYRPWVGLNRSGVDFPNSNPTAAVMDPYESPARTINLTTPLTFTSNNVPRIHGAGSLVNMTNTNIWLPQYYTTTVAGRPAWNDPHTKVEIRPGFTYQGGPDRTDCVADDADPSTCTYASEIQNFANWFTYYRSREYMAKAALGRTVSDVTNVRLAYVVLNDSNQRTPMASMNASYRVGNKKAMMDQIYKISSNNGTPLRAALDKAGKYFECKAGGSFGSPNTLPGDARCPVFPAPQGNCQNNFTLLFSDGTWNEAFAIGNKDGDANTLFDGGKYADNIASTLADVAMYYYERDLHPELSNGVPTTARDTAGAPTAAFTSNGELMHQHMKTFTIALGLEGNIDPATVPANYAVPFAWGDPFVDGLAKIDDMLHAAVNGRGQFLQANNPVLLSSALQSAFQEFSNGSVSVSAVAFNSTALREQTVEYRGFFNLKYNTGDLRALPVDAATGIVDEAHPLWRAAPVLDTQSADSRVIITYDRPNDVGIPFRQPSLNTDQRATLSINEVNYLRGDRSQEEPLGAFRARPQFEGMLGDIVHSAPQFVGGPRAIKRDQPPFPSSSLYSAFKDAQASREPLVYVAANDGMLHGFNASNGRERLGYVPNELIDSTAMFKNTLDQLSLLTYSHKFFVDVTPTVEDVFAPPYKGSIIKDWTTILVGGLGGGGKGYYALNVTNPGADYTSEATAKNTVLWEFTDQDDTYPVDDLGTPLGGAVGALVDTFGSPIKDLGYTYSTAQIVMTNVNDGGTPAQKKWAAIFGNGYNSSAGIAKLFVLPVEDGLNSWQPGDFMKLNTGFGPTVAPDPQAGLPNGLGTPTLIDVDRNGTADIAYAGDRQGNLFRFNVSNTNPALWTVTKLFQATYTNGTTTNQPITTQPYVIKHPTLPGFIVIVGTGSYVTELDGVSTEIQSVYGIWDRGETAPATANSDTKATRLVRQTVTNVVDGTADGFQKLRYRVGESGRLRA